MNEHRSNRVCVFIRSLNEENFICVFSSNSCALGKKPYVDEQKSLESSDIWYESRRNFLQQNIWYKIAVLLSNLSNFQPIIIFKNGFDFFSVFFFKDFIVFYFVHILKNLLLDAT